MKEKGTVKEIVGPRKHILDAEGSKQETTTSGEKGSIQRANDADERQSATYSDTTQKCCGRNKIQVIASWMEPPFEIRNAS